MKRSAGPREVVCLSDDDESPRSSQQPALKSAKKEAEPVPTTEVTELKQQVAKLQKEKESAIRIAGAHLERVEFLETLLDKKRAKNDAEKASADELQNKVIALQKELEEERLRAAEAQKKRLGTRHGELAEVKRERNDEQQQQREEANDNREKDRERIDALLRERDALQLELQQLKEDRRRSADEPRVRDSERLAETSSKLEQAIRREAESTIKAFVKAEEVLALKLEIVSLKKTIESMFTEEQLQEKTRELQEDLRTTIDNRMKERAKVDELSRKLAMYDASGPSAGPRPDISAQWLLHHQQQQQIMATQQQQPALHSQSLIHLSQTTPQQPHKDPLSKKQPGAQSKWDQPPQPQQLHMPPPASLPLLPQTLPLPPKDPSWKKAAPQPDARSKWLSQQQEKQQQMQQEKQKEQQQQPAWLVPQPPLPPKYAVKRVAKQSDAQQSKSSPTPQKQKPHSSVSAAHLLPPSPLIPAKDTPRKAVPQPPSMQSKQQPASQSKSLSSTLASKQHNNKNPSKKTIMITDPGVVSSTTPSANDKSTNIFEVVYGGTHRTTLLDTAIEQLKDTYFGKDKEWLRRCKEAVKSESLHCAVCSKTFVKGWILPHFFAANHHRKVKDGKARISLAAFEYWLRKLDSIPKPSDEDEDDMSMGDMTIYHEEDEEI